MSFFASSYIGKCGKTSIYEISSSKLEFIGAGVLSKVGEDSFFLNEKKNGNNAISRKLFYFFFSSYSDSLSNIFQPESFIVLTTFLTTNSHTVRISLCSRAYVNFGYIYRRLVFAGLYACEFERTVYVQTNIAKNHTNFFECVLCTHARPDVGMRCVWGSRDAL